MTPPPLPGDEQADSVLLSGWGRYPRQPGRLLTPATPEDARALLPALDGVIARGNGRSYGDAAAGTRATLATGSLDRFRAFDPATGDLTVEAGTLLSEIIDAFLPRGFFPTVVPGTRFVTVGGAIAADVHGKNHGRDGGFGRHVRSLRLALADGTVLRTAPDENAEIFRATIGGMGLTGLILDATIRLRPIETTWIRQQTLVAPDLTACLALLDRADAEEYSVAWIDALARGPALGRSLVFIGSHLPAGDPALSGRTRGTATPLRPPALQVPADLPLLALGRRRGAAFNAFYFHLGRRKARAPALVPLGSYFFPLDGIGGWNRLYGPKGFVQYQCVLPTDRAAPVLATILERVAHAGQASFLAVLKKLRPGDGLLSFPMDGYTLALDFPVCDALFPFLDSLDADVAAVGGRLYLAKDARQSPAMVAAGYPALDAFRRLRRTIDPAGRLRSRLSDRLGL